MALAHGTVLALAADRNIPVLQVSPQELKRCLTGSKTASKSDVQAALVELVAQRLELGRAQYGPLKVGQDPRDWEGEALEELLDGCIYLAAELLHRRRGAR